MTLRNRIWACALALCLAFSAFLLPCGMAGFAVPAAQAESDREILEIRMSAEPAEMVEPGDAMLSFSFVNTSDVDAQNVYLSSSDGLFSEPVGQLAAGGTHSFNRLHSVTQDELDKGEISYIISHDDPSDSTLKVNYTVRCAISRGDILPRAEFTRQLSSRKVSAGSTLIITYRIRNTGNVALNNLRVQDALGDYTGRVERLEVGESRTLISRATITEESVSSAMLDYHAEGMEDELFTQSLADVTVRLTEAKLDTLFSANWSAFAQDSADAVLILHNTGTADIRDIRVTDDIYGGVIAEKIVLKAGSDPIEVSRTYPVRGNEGYRWRITGTSEAGETIDILTDTAALPAAEAAQPARLLIEAEVHTPRIRRAGDVKFSLRISNTGGTDVRNVMLEEATLGELRNFEIIPARDFVEREFSFHVAEDTAFSFAIHYADTDGNPQSISASPAQVVIVPDGVLPEGAKQRFIEFTGTSIKIGGSSTFAVLLIAGLAVLLVLIIMLIIASRKARIEKQLRIAAEKKRRKEEMGKTNRFTPVRAPKSKSKGKN